MLTDEFTNKDLTTASEFTITVPVVILTSVLGSGTTPQFQLPAFSQDELMAPVQLFENCKVYMSLLTASIRQRNRKPFHVDGILIN